MLYHSAFMMPEGSRVHNTESSAWIQVPKYFESVRKYHYGSNYYIDDFREHRKVWETCTKQLNIQQKLLSLANNDKWRSRYTDLLQQHTHGRHHICSRERQHPPLSAFWSAFPHLFQHSPATAGTAQTTAISASTVTSEWVDDTKLRPKLQRQCNYTFHLSIPPALQS